MADIKISELTAALTVGDSDVIPMTASGSTVKASASLLKQYNNGTTDISGIGDGTPTGAISTLNSGKAPKSDLASISITGSTNNTGNTIAKGTYFYKDGALVRAKTDIANSATLTLNTNYEAVTVGGFNILNSAISGKLDNYKAYTIEAGESVTVTLSQNSVYLIAGRNNISKLASILFAAASSIDKTDLVTSTGFGITTSGLDVTLQNNMAYWIGFSILRIS